MSTPTSQKPRQLALVGNPNCGKTALFNRLTGARAKVANYPGVTVEKRIGRIGQHGDWLVDLPGSYSLFVASPDEEVARRLIMGELDGEQRPDALIAVVDACNIKLGLRLVLELQTLGMPMILALNMADEAQRRGIQINTQRLSEQLHIPVVTTVAIRQQGTENLLNALETLPSQASPQVIPDSVEACYAHIDTVLSACVSAPSPYPAWQDKLDRVLLHPIAGSLILLSILFLMFQAVFAWAGPFMEWIKTGIALLGELAGQVLPEGILKEFVVNGLIAGTGSVLVFLPQILILFAFILTLEDSGYLPRAAFLLDKLMRGVGLSGRSFIPMLSSFACAVPGIMSTRSIADPKERWIAIMVAPLMTCSARLPVYALVIGAFIPDTTVWGGFNLQGVTLFVLYMAGIVSAALVAWIFRRQKTIESNGFPLLMELPSYRWPNAYHFVIGLKERAWVFISRVGTIILALSIVLWFLSTYPAAPADATASAIEYSYAGMLGKFMAPLFEPLGFTWQMCIALIPAMAAREVAVSALATVYAVGEGEALLGEALGHSWPLPVALAYLAWFVYAPQCLSTIAVVRRETNSVRSTTLFVFYLFAMAYVAAWLTRIIAS